MPKIKFMSDSNLMFVTSNQTSSGSLIVKIDTSGNILQKTIVMLSLQDFVEANDKGFILVGNGSLTGIKTSKTSYYQLGIMKTDSVGNSDNYCIFPMVANPADTSTLHFYSTTYTIDTTQLTAKQLHPEIATTNLLITNGCVGTGSAIDENIAGNNFINVYPNPTTDIITIESSLNSKNATVYIYNIQGQLLLQQPVENYKMEIDISGFCKGVYLVRALGEDVNVVKKIMKE